MPPCQSTNSDSVAKFGELTVARLHSRKKANIWHILLTRGRDTSALAGGPLDALKPSALAAFGRKEIET